MEDNQLYASIEHLINRVNSIPAVSEEGLKQMPFPDEVIAALHNELGNTKQFVDDINTAFNASEQYASISASQKALNQASDALFTLASKDIIPQTEYDALIQLVHDVDEELRKLTDADFS